MRLRCGTGAEPPQGSFTAADYAAYARLPYTTAVWRLSRLVEVGKLKSALFRSKNGSRQRFYWLACLLLCALFGHAQTQVDINRQTRGVLQLNRGGTGQTSWVGGRCVQVAPDGSKLEVAPAACMSGTGTAGSFAKWAGSSALEGSSLSESPLEIFSSKPIRSPLWDRGGAVFNVRAYGAKGDLSDDTAAVQAAIDAASAVAGVVYFPPGRYYITAPLRINFGITIEGAKAGFTYPMGAEIIRAGATGNLFEVNAADLVVFRDLVITSGLPNSSSGAAIQVNRSAGQAMNMLHIENVWVAGLWRVVDADRVVKLRIINSYFARGNAVLNGSVAVRVVHSDNSDACENQFYGNFLEGWETAIYAGCSSNNLVGNKFNGIQSYAFSFLNGSTATGQITIVGNNMDGPASRIKIATGATSGSVNRVTVSGNFIVVAQGSEAAIEISAAGSSQGIYNVLVANNNIQAYTIPAAIRSSAHTTVYTRGNVIENTGAVGYGIQSVGYTESAADKFTGAVFTTSPFDGNILVQDFQLAFAQLGTFANGSYGYCSDCTAATPCAGGGTGAMARRINGAWVCSEGGGVAGSGTAGRLPVWASSSSLGDSALSQNATAVTVDRSLVVQGQVETQSTEAGSVTLNSTSGGSVTLQAPSTSSNFTLTLPAANGTLELQGHEHDASDISSGTLPVSRGGTGATSFTGGRCIQSSADGQSLTVASGACAVDGHSHTLAGDVTGDVGSTTVARIRGRNVSSAAPSDGQALVWSASESQWKPATVSGGSFEPLDEGTVWYRENFPNVATGSGSIGTYGWASSCSGGSISHTGTGNGGKAVRMTTGTTSGNYCTISLGSVATSDSLLGKIGAYASWDSVFRFRLNGTGAVKLFVGYLKGGITDPWSGERIGLEFDTTQNDTQFMFVTSSSGTTRQASGVTADTGWHKLRIRSETSGTITFTLDDGSDVSINTNVSTTRAFNPIFFVSTQEAAAKSADALRWYWRGPDVR
jgi:hypothetical protein